MNSAQLLSTFDLISESPDAIPRLRRFILDLAVRGKLVEQDPRDEPASELLNRIEAERLKLIKEGKLKRQEPLSPVTEDELRFPIPDGWQPTRLAVVAACLDYMREPINSSERDQRIAGKKPSELFPYFGATQQQGWIDDYIFDEKLVLLGEDGVPFFDDLRPKAYLISGKTWVNNHAHVFRGILVSRVFLVHCLNTFDYKGRVVGATRSKLNQAKATDIPIILPPLAEQHRIVAKVDELMAQCDRLEAAHAERESRRDGLAAASLHGLNNETDADAFCGHARFYFNHFPRLTTRAEHIHQLRQTILTLAVRGKLVTQDPSDEPALTFLKRIAKDWRKRDESVDDLTSDAFEVPNTWIWIKLGACVESMSNGIYKPAKFYSETGTACVRMFNIQDGRLDLSKLKRLDLSKEEIEHYRLEPGDLLVNRVNSRELVGKCAVVTASEEPLVFEAMNIRVRLVERQQLSHYINLVLRTERVRALFQGAAKQAVGQASVNQPQVANMAIPLPPLAEQHRIVAKVDDLMVLCDRLEAQLTISQSESRRLLEAVLHEALSPSEGEVVS
jgi:type I restriction enzyme, S subunit